MKKKRSTSRKANSPRIGVYAGTFDPITNGHVDIAHRAAELFDEVVIAVASGSHKTPLLSLEERVRLTKRVLSKSCFKIVPFDGLLVDFVREQRAEVIIRGLRAVSDYEYEAQMAMANRQLAPDLETVFLMTSDRCSFITSSIVREVARHGGELKALVPPAVATYLKKLLR